LGACQQLGHACHRPALVVRPARCVLLEQRDEAHGTHCTLRSCKEWPKERGHFVADGACLQGRRTRAAVRHTGSVVAGAHQRFDLVNVDCIDDALGMTDRCVSQKMARLAYLAVVFRAVPQQYDEVTRPQTRHEVGDVEAGAKEAHNLRCLRGAAGAARPWPRTACSTAQAARGGGRASQHVLGVRVRGPRTGSAPLTAGGGRTLR
jgi:hypothetical protein